jgi:putative chitinase
VQLIHLDQLVAVMPGARAVASTFIEPLECAMFEFAIVSTRRVQHFLAQIAHESGQLKKMQEGLNYSAERLMQVWPSRFPTRVIADAYARRPEAIANKVYADRMGNGSEKSGDGWRHRGAGLIALTGKANQARCAEHFGIDPQAVGDWLRTPEGACRSAAWFWHRAGCNELADKNDLDGVSDAINIGHQTAADGDAIGFADRLEFFNVTQKVFA